jgi:DNA polymerase (family 10)
VPRESFGAALYYFTGSKAHNIAIRRLAQAKGLKINEYGVFAGAQRIAGETEASVLHAVDLPFIPPELRESQGELEAARDQRLPQLVELADLRGDLHAYVELPLKPQALSKWVAAARAAGLEYIAVTRPIRTQAARAGADAQEIRALFATIDQLNLGLRKFRVLKGLEASILEDGRLGATDALLKEADLVMGVLDSHLEWDRAPQTQRVLRALDQPWLTILAHPTGRILGGRPGAEFDMEQVIRRAHERHRFLELSGQPERLELRDTHCRLAKASGVLVSIASGARVPEDCVAQLGLGVTQARRGWLEPRDVLNSRSLAELQALLGSPLSG